MRFSCEIKEEMYHISSSLGLKEEVSLISRELYHVHLRIDGRKCVKAVRSKAMLGKSLRILGNLVSCDSTII